MRLSIPAVFLLSAASVWAQPTPNFRQPLELVKQFLQLTDSQLQMILASNDDYNRFVYEKQSRIWQVQMEIGEETAREPLDPAALGIRYAEIEAICRLMKDRAEKLQTRNRDVLNPDQKSKLKVLEDALKLGPVILDAQFGNRMGDSSSGPYGFSSVWSRAFAGGLIGGVSGCYLPFQGLQILQGDFSGIAAPLMNRTPQRWFDTPKFVIAPAPERQPK